MQVCSKDKIADAYAKVCQRTTPLLPSQPRDDLVLLGRVMYRKCLPLGMSTVALHIGQPIALNTQWDAAEVNEEILVLPGQLL